MRAILFDMDGLLIDSEPLWKDAEREVFARVGVTIPAALAEITMGLRTDEVTAFWYARQPWSGASLEEVENAVIEQVGELIATRGAALPGVAQVLDFFAARKYRMAIASNSPDVLIDAVLRKLAIGHYFQVLCSSVHEPQGKPHPGVYLTAAARLGVAPERCLVFEDSVPGIRAAKAAGMTAVAVPAPELAHDPAFALADLRLGSLREWSAARAAALGFD